MTERTNDIDQAERIRRLQERRAASGKSRAAATRNTVDGDEHRQPARVRRAQRARRRHPGQGNPHPACRSQRGVVLRDRWEPVAREQQRGDGRADRRRLRATASTLRRGAASDRHARHDLDRVARARGGAHDDARKLRFGLVHSRTVRSQTWWYVARAGGIVSWALATLAVIGGLQLSTRLVRRPAPAWVLDVHRFVAGLSVVFVAVHLVGLAADTFIQFSVADLFVPFASSYKPGALALGIVAMYILLAVEITSLLMKRMSRRVWHGIHFSSYALFVFATVHALLVGTDRHNRLLQVATLAAAAVVLFMTLVRILAPRRGAATPTS